MVDMGEVAVRKCSLKDNTIEVLLEDARNFDDEFDDNQEHSDCRNGVLKLVKAQVYVTDDDRLSLDSNDGEYSLQVDS